MGFMPRSTTTNLDCSFSYCELFVRVSQKAWEMCCQEIDSGSRSRLALRCMDVHNPRVVIML